MKKSIVLIALFLYSIFSYCQKSICGVDFGSSYETAKSILGHKFGQAEIDKDKEIWYFNRDYAGFNFSAIKFHFQSDGYNTYFNECVFCNKFNDVSLAKKFEKKLLAKLSEKYENMVSDIDDNGFLVVSGGVSPVSSGIYGFHVFVSKDDKEGEYIVFLGYGSYDYANEEF